jgi:DNA-binding beta-propeller fold protein YncE
MASTGPSASRSTPTTTCTSQTASGNTIRKVLPDGTTEPFASSSLFNCPNGITLASDGNFYVANFLNGDVQRIAPDGTVSRHVTIEGGNNGTSCSETECSTSSPAWPTGSTRLHSTVRPHCWPEAAHAAEEMVRPATRRCH